jgi:hypothetical protein
MNAPARLAPVLGPVEGRASSARRRGRRGAGTLRAVSMLAAVAMLAACASAPPPPDWQSNARQSLDAAIAAALEGNARTETAEAARARREIARSGRLDLLARAELMLCATRVASLAFEPCAGFETLRAEAAPAERAYADYLAGRAPPDVALLPPAQRAAATAGSAEAANAALRAIDDPLSRLIAAAVVLQSGRASPQTLELASDTASAQGWRRPLLAWLQARLMRVERIGDSAEAARLKRQIGLVQSDQ